MRVVFMGTPAFAVPTLEQLIRNHYQVVAVYTQPDRPSGRGQTLIATPVKAAALQLNLPVVQPARLKSPEAVAELATLKPDLIVVAAYGQILPQAVLDIPLYGCINIHPSLLPKYRGASPVASAILAGDDFTGVSIMLLDAGMDTGPVLVQAAVPISSQDNTGTLTDKLSLVGARLLDEALVAWTRKEIAPRAQNEADVIATALVTKENGEIDWKLPAVEIWRRIRAYNPWPMCYTKWRGRQLRIIEAEALPFLEMGEVGEVTILSGDETAPVVMTGSGLLAVTRLQIEGKKAMTAAEFLRGQRDFISAVLPS